MATSLNGWTAIPKILGRIDPRLTTFTIPGTDKKVTVRRECAPLFKDFLAEWNKQMPARLKITGPSAVAGYNYRPSRFTKGLSNHASGTAVDVRWDVLKADQKHHMTPGEAHILDHILAKYVTADGHHVLANGGKWSRLIDEMHTELSQGWDKSNHAKRDTTMADVKAVIKRLGLK